MKPFKLQAPCRLVTEIKKWDSHSGGWQVHRYKKPRLVENPPQKLTQEQSSYLEKYIGLLAEKTKLNANARNQKEKIIEEYFLLSEADDV